MKQVKVIKSFHDWKKIERENKVEKPLLCVGYTSQPKSRKATDKKKNGRIEQELETYGQHRR